MGDCANISNVVPTMERDGLIFVTENSAVVRVVANNIAKPPEPLRRSQHLGGFDHALEQTHELIRARRWHDDEI